jgi:hypothetical protein
MMRRSIATQKITMNENVNKNIIYYSKVIFEVIISRIRILSLRSNIFPLSTSKTVCVRGIHVINFMGLWNVRSMATGGETRLHALHRMHH